MGVLRYFAQFISMLQSYNLYPADSSIGVPYRQRMHRFSIFMLGSSTNCLDHYLCYELIQLVIILVVSNNYFQVRALSCRWGVYSIGISRNMDVFSIFSRIACICLNVYAL